MRTYFSIDKRGYGVVLGNITSYGWINPKADNKDGTYLWADSDIEIAGVRFVWQFWIDKSSKIPHVRFQLEKLQ